MNELMKLENGEVKIDSRMIAEHFGKRHDHVLRDIKDEIEKLENAGLEAQPIFGESYYTNQQNKKQPCYTMTEEGALQLAARYDAVARRKLIIMIRELRQQQNAPKKLSHLEQLRLQYQVLEDHDNRISSLENNMTVDYGQQLELSNKAKRRATELLGGKERAAYISKSVSSKTFSAIWKDYKDYFQINSYKNTPKKDFDKAILYLDQWKPNGKLQRLIDGENNQTSMFREVM